MFPEQIAQQLTRGATYRKISVRPDNRTGRIEVKYRPDRTGHYQIISVDRLYSELDKEYDKKQSERLLKNSEKKSIFFFKIKMPEIFLLLSRNGLTLNGPWYDFVPVKICKLLNAPADRMVKKTLD